MLAGNNAAGDRGSATRLVEHLNFDRVLHTGPDRLDLEFGAFDRDAIPRRWRRTFAPEYCRPQVFPLWDRECA